MAKSFCWTLLIIGSMVISMLGSSAASKSTHTKRAAPVVANGDFEQGPLRPAWKPYTTGKANAIIVTQPNNSTNHVARLTENCNACMCDDDECCSVNLVGTVLNIIPSASYSITYQFMYPVDVGYVYHYSSASHCDQNGCQSSLFENVKYPKTAKANKFYTYSASFRAPANANDGRLSLDVYPTTCDSRRVFLDNFKIFGPF